MNKFSFFVISTILILGNATSVPYSIASEHTLVAQAVNIANHNVSINHRKVDGKKTIRVKQGDKVELIWHTDEKVELHLHGYDIEVTAKVGTPTKMTFNANATGRFPVTSHGFGNEKGHSHGSNALFYIEVHPK